MLVKSPLIKFSKLTGTDGVLSTHATKQYHERAMLVAQDFIMRYENPAEKIVNKISASRLKQAVENRARLHPIFETIILCGRQNLPLREHRDDGDVLNNDTSVNDGNFRALLRYRVAGGDTKLESHLKEASSNAKYVSKTTQNNLIHYLARIREAAPFSVIFDETTDENGIEHVKKRN